MFCSGLRRASRQAHFLRRQGLPELSSLLPEVGADQVLRDFRLRLRRQVRHRQQDKEKLQILQIRKMHSGWLQKSCLSQLLLFLNPRDPVYYLLINLIMRIVSNKMQET